MPRQEEILLRREPVAAHLHRHLEAVCVQVVEVLHACLAGEKKGWLKKKKKAALTSFFIAVSQPFITAYGLMATSSGCLIYNTPALVKWTYCLRRWTTELR